MKRVPLSKKVRFSIFARDAFTCRYCGRQSDAVVLEVDHVIPVCDGGTNDESNLVTSCEDCNRGKSGSRINTFAANETDRLRLVQELSEQRQAAETAIAIATERAKLRAAVMTYWSTMTGRSRIDGQTLSVVLSYARSYGFDTVARWIDSASFRCDNDVDMGRYISGIRRSVEKEKIAHA